METVLTFYLGDILFGISIALVKEVQRRAEYQTVPGAPPHLQGLMNLRGQVVTLFDLERMLLGKMNPVQERSRCVVLKPRAEDPHYTGFFIDRAGDVLEVSPEREMPVPANFRGMEPCFFKAVVPLQPEKLLVIVRMEEILDRL